MTEILTPETAEQLSQSLVSTDVESEYEILSTIRKDAHTCLYKARRSAAFSPVEGSPVALKVLDCKQKRRRSLAVQLKTEATLMQAVLHDNVVRVLEFQNTEAVCFLAMEYAELGDLRAYLQRHGRPSIAEAFSMMDQLLAGLAAVHQAGIVHGDIRPETLHLNAESVLKIGNFRFPSIIRSGDTPVQNEWIGRMMDYLAPEILASGSYSQLGDVYAAGVLCYELFAGELPFVGAIGAQLESKRLGMYAPITRIPDSIKAGIDKVLKQALAVESAWIHSVRNIRCPLSASLLPANDCSHRFFPRNPACPDNHAQAPQCRLLQAG